MNKISITEAAKLAGISRQHLYKTYINTGKLSVVRENEKVYVDVSELLRVFPNCKLSVTQESQVLTPKDNNNLQVNNEVIDMLKAQLAEAKEREEWLKQQIDELRKQQNNLLEDKTAKKRKKIFGIF